MHKAKEGCIQDIKGLDEHPQFLLPLPRRGLSPTIRETKASLTTADRGSAPREDSAENCTGVALAEGGASWRGW